MAFARIGVSVFSRWQLTSTHPSVVPVSWIRDQSPSNIDVICRITPESHSWFQHLFRPIVWCATCGHCPLESCIYERRSVSVFLLSLKNKDVSLGLRKYRQIRLLYQLPSSNILLRFSSCFSSLQTCRMKGNKKIAPLCFCYMHIARIYKT